MMTTDASTVAGSAVARGFRVIRPLVAANLTLVALQAISAGFLMSGYARALAVHASVAGALQLCTLVQAVAAAVLWRRRRFPAWVAGVSAAFFVIVFLQSGLGYRRSYWLHVPLGVAIFGGLTRQLR